MAYSIHEQEEIEGFKHFWRSGGAMVCIALLLAAFGYLGWKFYQGNQKENLTQASEVLTNFSTHLMEQKKEDAAKELATLKSKYKNTSAAAAASLAMAGVLFEDKKYPEAQAELEWVLTNNQEPTINALATQRLANLQIQQKQYDKALATIAKPVAPEYEGISLDIKGDILYFQGKKKEAAEAYELALAKIPKNTAGYPLVELKRDQAKN